MFFSKMFEEVNHISEHINIENEFVRKGFKKTTSLFVTNGYGEEPYSWVANLNQVRESKKIKKFRFKENKKESIGLIAHELQEEYPFLVEGDKDEPVIQSVNYNGLIGVLIKEIQELKKRVYYLENNK